MCCECPVNKSFKCIWLLRARMFNCHNTHDGLDISFGMLGSIWQTQLKLTVKINSSFTECDKVKYRVPQGWTLRLLQFEILTFSLDYTPTASPNSFFNSFFNDSIWGHILINTAFQIINLESLNFNLKF